MFTDKPNNDKKVCLNGQKVRKEADEKSPSSLCTIQVSGMKETTSKDTLEFYFHNKKSGGGGVKKVNGEVEDGFLLITFENEKSRFSTVSLYDTIVRQCPHLMTRGEQCHHILQ